MEEVYNAMEYGHLSLDEKEMYLFALKDSFVKVTTDKDIIQGRVKGVTGDHELLIDKKLKPIEKIKRVEIEL